MVAYRDRLEKACSERARLCVGLDPHQSLVEKWGLSYDVAGAERLARQTVAALAETVAVFKPQSAFFECFGPEGISALKRVLDDIRQAGALSILDVKRGDIGSTMAAYASAYLAAGAPLAADAVTLSPYCGFEALRPALDLAKANDRGVYVLCRTSNPEGESLQRGQVASGTTVSDEIAALAHQENLSAGTAYVGLVIGATRNNSVELGDFAGSILAPGIGAQGGKVSDLDRLFGQAVSNVLPSSSRGILAAGPKPQDLREAVTTAV